MATDKFKFGVEGLDDLLGGGIPHHHWIATIGPPGTFKTIMGIQFIYQGLSEGGQAVFIVTEELRESVVRQAKMLGKDLTPFEKSGDLKIISAIGDPSFKLSEGGLENQITDVVRKMGLASKRHRRLVIDSITVFWADKPAMSRKIAISIKNRLVSLFDCVYLTVQTASTKDHGFGFGADFIADGVIYLGDYLEDGESKYWIHVRKMRECAHNTRVHIVKIVDKEGAMVGKPLLLKGRGASVADLLSGQ